MWNRCGFCFPIKCAHVDSMWTRCGLESTSKTRSSLSNVDPMWTRCGLAADPSPHLEHVVVYQIGTRSPFGIYNIIGGVSGRVHMATTATLYWVPVVPNGNCWRAVGAPSLEIGCLFLAPGPTSRKTIAWATAQWATETVFRDVVLAQMRPVHLLV